MRGAHTWTVPPTRGHATGEGVSFLVQKVVTAVGSIKRAAAFEHRTHHSVCVCVCACLRACMCLCVCLVDTKRCLPKVDDRKNRMALRGERAGGWRQMA